MQGPSIRRPGSWGDDFDVGFYVDDHSRAIWTIVEKGRNGETYNIGAENEWKNIDLVHLICEKIADLQKKEKDTYKKLINFVKYRPGHDLRYASDCNKIE